MEDIESFRLLLNRPSVLRALDGEPQDTEQLRSALDLSDSTIDRALSELQEAGYVEPCEEGYRTTLTGRLTLGAYDRFKRRLGSIQEAIELLSVLDSNVPLVPAVVWDAEIVRASGAHTTRIERLLERAQRIRWAPATISEPYLELYREQVAAGTELSLVGSSSFVERLVTTQHEQLIESIDTGQVTLRQAETEPPFGLTIVESDGYTAVELRVSGTDGLRGSIINDTPNAVAWATTQYEQLWGNALSVHQSDENN